MSLVSASQFIINHTGYTYRTTIAVRVIAHRAVGVSHPALKSRQSSEKSIREAQPLPANRKLEEECRTQLRQIIFIRRTRINLT